jgi:hypothetical protein
MLGRAAREGVSNGKTGGKSPKSTKFNKSRNSTLTKTPPGCKYIVLTLHGRIIYN